MRKVTGISQYKHTLHVNTVGLRLETLTGFQVFKNDLSITSFETLMAHPPTPLLAHLCHSSSWGRMMNKATQTKTRSGVKIARNKTRQTDDFLSGANILSKSTLLERICTGAHWTPSHTVYFPPTRTPASLCHCAHMRLSRTFPVCAPQCSRLRHRRVWAAVVRYKQTLAADRASFQWAAPPFLGCGFCLLDCAERGWMNGSGTERDTHFAAPFGHSDAHGRYGCRTVSFR